MEVPCNEAMHSQVQQILEGDIDKEDLNEIPKNGSLILYNCFSKQDLDYQIEHTSQDQRCNSCSNKCVPKKCMCCQEKICGSEALTHIVFSNYFSITQCQNCSANILFGLSPHSIFNKFYNDQGILFQYADQQISYLKYLLQVSKEIEKVEEILFQRNDWLLLSMATTAEKDQEELAKIVQSSSRDGDSPYITYIKDNYNKLLHKITDLSSSVHAAMDVKQDIGIKSQLIHKSIFRENTKKFIDFIENYLKKLKIKVKSNFRLENKELFKLITEYKSVDNEWQSLHKAMIKENRSFSAYNVHIKENKYLNIKQRKRKVDNSISSTLSNYSNLSINETSEETQKVYIPNTYTSSNNNYNKINENKQNSLLGKAKRLIQNFEKYKEKEKIFNDKIGLGAVNMMLSVKNKNPGKTVYFKGFNTIAYKKFYYCRELEKSLGMIEEKIIDFFVCFYLIQFKESNEIINRLGKFLHEGDYFANNEDEYNNSGNNEEEDEEYDGNFKEIMKACELRKEGDVTLKLAIPDDQFTFENFMKLPAGQSLILNYGEVMAQGRGSNK